MVWTIITGIAALISTVTYIITALYVRAQLKGIETDRYLAITHGLFTLWQSEEFMKAQLWLLHKLEETTWESFVAAHRADVGEMAFHRVGSFYDRVGTLAKMGLVDEKEILTTIGGYAIAVWQKIGPLVHEARRIENSVLFQDYERMLPACHECYVPALKGSTNKTEVDPFSIPTRPSISIVQPELRITQAKLRRRLQQSNPPVLVDVRRSEQVAQVPYRLPGAVMMPPDEVETRYRELPLDRDIVVYCA